MQLQDSSAALDASVTSQGYNYDPATYHQYAQERSMHDQGGHKVNSSTASSSSKATTSSSASQPKERLNADKLRPKLEATTSPTSAAKVQNSLSAPAASRALSTPTVRNEALKSNRLCTMPGCTKRVRSKGLCKAHGGGRRCMVDGCERSSQGQGLCIRHGGGKRCTQSGCTKASQSNGLCKAHGGGLRCQSAGCTKSSQGGGFCRAHGGGQRCEKEGCNKGAQRGGFCAGHGGSRFCQHPDCTKNDRGGGFCAEHGGGKRCDHAGCNKPARKKGKCSYHANATKSKLSKDQLATAGVGSGVSLPQHMMDMRQITTPTFAMGVKDLRDPHVAASQVDAQRAAYVQQQRLEMDMRYKSYEGANAGQYLQIHADQRSYEPISLQAGGAARHYMAADNGALPPVSSGSMYKPPGAMERQTYGPRGTQEQMKNPYSQHWATKPELSQHHPDARVDYFDVKEQQQPPQQAGHHHPYSTQSSQYHHHLSAADSAAAAAAYGQQQQQQQQQQQPPRAFYSQQQPPSAAPSDQPASQQQNMMYYSANGYPQHQMHSMQTQQQMQML
uniref:WRKY19-like zinc finger domain-containing protein n=1 Tax=Peronospora matthiolae TaxID=2874970 RepID=A0AAV1UWC5_9STRA